jgi:hypothetical protein
MGNALGFLVNLGLNPSQATQVLGSFEKDAQGSFKRVVDQGSEPLNKNLLTNRESVRLLSEEMGVHLPRAVSSAIGEILPRIGDLSNVLMGAFAVESVIKFGEMVAKDTEKIYGMKEAEKALSEIGKENLELVK